MLKRCSFIIVICICVLLGALAPAASADGLGIQPELLLEPTGAIGGNKLTAFSADAHITCVEDVCTLEMVQTYWLHNAGAEAFTLEFGLPADAGSWPAEQAALWLDGNPLDISDTSEAYQAIWHITLSAGQHAALALHYQHTFSPSQVLATAVELDRLVSNWGLPEGARVRFVLADAVGDDAVLWMVPFISRFDGRQITWDYEIPNELISHQFVLLRPDIWQELQQSITSQDNGRLAGLYMQIDEALMAFQIPRRNYFSQAVAAYTAAITNEPHNPSLYMGLARAYHNRAVLLPEESLNYELLAVQLLEQAHILSPDDTEIAEQLAGTYYAVALAFAEQGSQETALVYLSRLQAGGLPEVESEDKLQTLALRWSVELAEQGDNELAYDQARQLLPETTLQLLQDYAPPLVGLETIVSTDPGSRQVSYRIQMYPGTSTDTIARIADLAERLKTVSALEIKQIEQETSYELTLTLRYNTLSELQSRINDIKVVINQENSILMHLLQVPWNNAPEELREGGSRLKREIAYRERFDSSSLQLAWQEQSQYAQWRLAETTNNTEIGEVEQLEARLTTYLLKQQQQVWRQLPASSSWKYRLQMEPNTEPQEWICSFGENRLLIVERTAYNESLLRLMGLVSLGLILLAIFALLMPWSSLQKPRD